jgi:hypothetical protein
MKKLIKDVTLKSGVIIPKDTPVSIKWLLPEENGHAVAQVLPAGFDPYKTRISSLYLSVSGFSKQPSYTTMYKWMNGGIAKSVTGQRVEPDGFGPDGSPSWMLAAGVI